MTARQKSVFPWCRTAYAIRSFLKLTLVRWPSGLGWWTEKILSVNRDTLPFTRSFTDRGHYEMPLEHCVGVVMKHSIVSRELLFADVWALGERLSFLEWITNRWALHSHEGPTLEALTIALIFFTFEFHFQRSPFSHRPLNFIIRSFFQQNGNRRNCSEGYFWNRSSPKVFSLDAFLMQFVFAVSRRPLASLWRRGPHQWRHLRQALQPGHAGGSGGQRSSAPGHVQGSSEELQC